MIYGIFGNPGSGKSYYIIKELILTHILDTTIISNIKLAKNLEIDNYVYLEKNDIDNLHKNIINIMIQDELSHDNKKEKLARLFNFYIMDKTAKNVMLIVDECHMYGYDGTKKETEPYDRFLSIHRHIYQDSKFDVVLCTQVPERISTIIGKQMEYLVKGLSASERIKKSFLEYEVYLSMKDLKSSNKKQRVKKLVVKGKPEIFELYESGFKESGSNDMRKKLFMLVGFALLVLAFVGYKVIGLNDSYDTRIKGENMNYNDMINHEQNTTENIYNEALEQEESNETDSQDYIIKCITTNQFYSKKDIVYVIKSENNLVTVCYLRNKKEE